MIITSRHRIASMTLAVAGACGGGGTGSPDAGGNGNDAGVPDAAAAAALTVVLSFDGETLSSGAEDDPESNTTPLISGEPVTFTFDESVMDTTRSRAEIIADITAATRAQFAAFDVAIRTDRPADVPYVLTVFGGQGSDIGNPGAVNFALLDCENAGGFPAVGLVLTDQAGALDNLTYDQQVARAAVLTAQAVGFGLGLETVTDCPDTMTSPFACTDQMFTDAEITCGVSSPADCICGGTTQNAVQRLETLL